MKYVKNIKKEIELLDSIPGIDEDIEFNLQFIISALVASLTVEGKAIGKNIAQNNSTKILEVIGKIIDLKKL